MRPGKIMTSLALFVVGTILLTGCRYGDFSTNARNMDDYDNFSYAYNGDEGFVYEYRWDGDTSNMDIYVPKEINGVKITGLGGYYGKGLPCMFGITIPSDFLNPEEESFDTFSNSNWVVDEDYTTLCFNVYTGSEVSERNGIGDLYYEKKTTADGNQDIVYKVEINYLYY